MKVVANMYDHVVIKGLSPVRRENGSEEDYFIYNDIENMGLISYIPKYITDSENFADPVKNKTQHLCRNIWCGMNYKCPQKVLI